MIIYKAIYDTSNSTFVYVIQRKYIKYMNKSGSFISDCKYSFMVFIIAN